MSAPTPSLPELLTQLSALLPELKSWRHEYMLSTATYGGDANLVERPALLPALFLSVQHRGWMWQVGFDGGSATSNPYQAIISGEDATKPEDGVIDLAWADAPTPGHALAAALLMALQGAQLAEAPAGRDT